MTMTIPFLRRQWLFAVAVMLVLSLPAQPRDAQASCNQIPGITTFFRGAHGTLDRPFASPNDFVDVRLSAVCDEHASFDAARGVLVSVIFTPPEGARNMIVIASDCQALQRQVEACGTQPNIAQVKCFQAQAVTITDPMRLRFPFPDAGRVLGTTLAGPATIAVTASDAPLPCALASTPCSAHPEMLACVDALFAVDGTCGTTVADPMFSHFTALPVRNDYQALCTDPVPPCTGTASELRLAVDAAGNLLLPMDWGGILLDTALPVARLLRGSSAIPAFPDASEPIHVPGSGFLQSFSPDGHALPPLFEPRRDPSATHEATLFGSADAPQTVLRISRRSMQRTACIGGSSDGRPCGEAGDCPDGVCGTATCAGGARAGQSCGSDGDCPGGECGPSLFDFRSRVADGVGPVIIPRFGSGVCQASGIPCSSDAACTPGRCVGYRLAAQDPVLLDGLVESPNVFVTVVPEAVDGADLNGDKDTTDDVLLLANRSTGVLEPIGVASAHGRAVTRIHEPPFSFPAVAVENDIVAFLEGEQLNGNIDVNHDGDTLDTPLRIFRSGDTAAQDLLPAPPVMANPEPVINGASVAVSAGLVFVRVSEMDAARRTVTRVSVTADGLDANGASGRPSLSKDARQVAFESTATNLIADASPQSRLTSYVAGVHGGGPQAVRLNSSVLPTDPAAVQPWLSGNGRYVTAAAGDTNGINQIFVYDRDADGNGVFDEPDGVSTTVVSVNAYGALSSGMSAYPVMSADGRFIVFWGVSYNLDLSDVESVAPDPRFPPHGIWVHDRLAEGLGPNHLSPTRLVSLAARTGIISGDALVLPPTVSADGHIAAWADFERNMVLNDTNDFCINLNGGQSCADVLVRDRLAKTTTLQSLSTIGDQGNNQSLAPVLSTDGRYLAFESAAGNLVSGDTNGTFDVFLRDLETAITTRISIATDSTQANDASFDDILSASDDARYIAFASTASNLVPGDTNNQCDNNFDGHAQENCSDIFIHDRITGFTERASVAAGGAQGNGPSHHASLSGDGRSVAFESTASNLTPNDLNNVCDNNGDGIANESCSDIFVVGPDRADPAADFNGDGDADDTLLEVFDTRQPGAAMSILAPASQVAVVGERAAFLSPEKDSETDLNGDGDTLDAVVQLYTGRNGRVINLRKAARAVALSDHWLAALVSEADEEHDLNGNGTQGDLVVHFTAADGSGSWTNLGVSATRVDVAGDTLAFTTLESAEGKDLNGDGDQNDLVLQIYDVTSGTLINTGQAVEEFVLVPGLVAFRTSEVAQGNQDLNGDHDTADFVMQVYDINSRQLINSGQAAIPCRFESCDPRRPYAVTPQSVKFLTLESQQGHDLNGNGDSNDLVLQTFNVPKAMAAQAVSGDGTSQSRRVPRFARTRAEHGSVQAGVLTTISSVSVGVCSDTGSACIGAADCGVNARCYLPPGSCVSNLHTACDAAFAADPCGENQFCVPTTTPGRGECHLASGTCTSDADCTVPAHCQESGQNVQRLISPLLTSGNGGVVFTAAGPAGKLVVAGAGDADADGIVDAFDNCPYVANTDQADANGNGVGDACEARAVTPSPTATATPAPRHVSEGCTILPQANGSVPPMVLLGAFVLWGLRRRHKRASRLRVPPIWLLVAAFVAIAAPSARAADPATACAGDCDGSGTVTVEELVTLVNIALGADTVATCSAGDIDGNGAITVDEVLVAVDHAMNSCPVPVDQLVGRIAALAHGLSYLPLYEPVLSAFFSAAGGSGECPSGGSFSGICADSGGGTIRIPIVAVQCALPTIEGTALLNGAAPLTGVGLCPSVLLPGGWQLAVDSSLVLENDSGAKLFESQFDITATVESLGFGAGPCRVRGGSASMTGNAAFAASNGGHAMLSMDGLHGAFKISEFSLVDTCQPETVAFTLDGAVRLGDVLAEPQMSVDATLHGVMVTIHRLTGNVEISGEIVAPWAGGSVTLGTAKSLARVLDQPCFAGGALTVDATGLHTEVSFGSDGSIGVDGGADGSIETRFASCLDAALRGGSPTP